MSTATHRTLGEPDFVIIADNGRVFFIECKTRVGKLSPAQLAMKHHAEMLGTIIHMVRTMDEFRQVIIQKHLNAQT